VYWQHCSECQCLSIRAAILEHSLAPDLARCRACHAYFPPAFLPGRAACGGGLWPSLTAAVRDILIASGRGGKTPLRPNRKPPSWRHAGGQLLRYITKTSLRATDSSSGGQEDAITSDHLVVISGCSGGGNPTLLTELGRRGYAMVEEPGRRIVKEELLGDGRALPWVDEIAFARRAIALAIADLAEAGVRGGWVFFDRGLIDSAAALQHLTGEPALTTVLQKHRFHHRVFLAPPWPEIWVTDTERRHSFGAGVAEYRRLIEVYPSLGYEVTILPTASVSERADFILSRLP
jgi:predicted ATPase